MPQGRPKEKQRPKQSQHQQPGLETEMRPRPVSEDLRYRGSGKLQGKVGQVLHPNGGEVVNG
ncbi:MAG TPA: hypothetical protein VFI11_04670 [Anaerolineales bacterium]|nr:hypothetical protein [Anaerolineales bacterium]